MKSTSSPTLPHKAGESAPATGVFPLRGGSVGVLAALPYGQCDAAALRAAAGFARDAGDGTMRLSFTRGVLLPGVAHSDAPGVLARLAAAGFITDPADPRLAIRACSGAPACGSALAAVRTDADRLARALDGFIAAGRTLHLSGCAKGCASPAAASLTLVARGGGLYDATMNGTVRDTPTRTLPLEEVPGWLAAP